MGRLVVLGGTRMRALTPAEFERWMKGRVLFDYSNGLRRVRKGHWRFVSRWSHAFALPASVRLGSGRYGELSPFVRDSPELARRRKKDVVGLMRHRHASDDPRYWRVNFSERKGLFYIWKDRSYRHRKRKARAARRRRR